MKKYPIHLPQTSFPMRGQLPQTEPKYVEFWKKESIHSKIQEKYKNNTPLTFIDGPPYANGRIHLGTALNKILKDMLTKQAWLVGRPCDFTPIWDCHGLPIELSALKKTKSREPQEVRKFCRKEAQKWIQTQEEQFQRLGVIADWENKILTMNADYEAEEIRVMALLNDKKLLYRGKRPIHWCMKLQTAIAASEVEYFPHQSPAIDVKFEVSKSQPKNKISLPDSTFFVIWTTTPWTLPANQAICLHPDMEYGLYETQNEHLIIALYFHEAFEKRCSLKLKLKKQFKGKELESLIYKHPFYERTSPVVLGTHVTTEAGTGCVHTAPGHGAEDFVVGKKYNIPITCPVNPKGQFTEEVPEYEGQNVLKCNELIIERLQTSSHLLHLEEIEHSYPHNPRSKSPLIFRLTDQWFLSFDQPGLPIRETALKEIQKIKFIPTWSENRLKSMIKESPDWCLSRQRIWGVPIPVFYCAKCSHPWLNSSFMNDLADQMEKTGEGIEYYFSRETKELIPAEAHCEKCSHKEWIKGEDILDVWLDSGICHTIIKKIKNLFPADVYFEGSDQHRGWFQTSLNSSIALYKTTPFKTLITHGFLYDLEKRKMSKSLGNIISPEEVIKKHGAEILRLWVASCDYTQDISSGEEVFSRVRETYRRMRNTIRFLIGNLHDFELEKDPLSLSQMNEVDQWILSQLHELSESILNHYQNFEFHKVYQQLNQFFTVTLSSFYLDIIKDRLYTFKGPERKSAQTAIHHLLKNLLSLMSPLTSFLSEEAYQHLSGPKEESIFLDSFKKLDFKNSNLDEKFNIMLQIRPAVMKEIEVQRQQKILGSSLEAQINLTLPSSTYNIFKDYKDLNEFFNASQVSIEKGSEVKIQIQKAPGQKCQRCWIYSTDIGSEEICPKCAKNI